MSEVVTATFVFTDLVGSTALGSRLGPVGADEIRAVHFGLLRGAVSAAGGTEVKNLGDGLMVMFTSAGRALSCAVAMQQAVEVHNRRTEVPLSIRVGISAGEVTADDGDFFGDPVIEAARLCGLAADDQILATETVSVLVGRVGTQVLRPVGDLELKGIPVPVPCVEVEWEPEAADADALVLPSRLSGVIAHAMLGLFGREVERATIADVAKIALAERSPQLVAVAGEPGMGKTTLVSWAARALHGEGATVLFGRCDEALSVPFRPWIEAVEHLVSNLPDEVLAGHVAQRGDTLARWVPDLSPDGVKPSSSSDVESDRFVLFGAVTDLLERAGSDRLVVVILDDVQWADAASLQLLHHVLTVGLAAPMLVLATYRDSDLARGDRLTKFLADSRRENNVTRVDLAGFADDELVALVEAATGRELTEPGIALARALQRETKGNPFFTSEMLRHLASSGAIGQGAPGRLQLPEVITEVGLPTSVRDVVGRRVDRLGDDAVTVLRAAAVIGLRFEVDVLVELVDVDEDAVLDVLEAAAIASLLEEDHDAVGRFTFLHGLVRQTLYQDLSATRRRRIHRHIAETLEARAGTERGSPAELAAHFIAATRPGDATKAIQYASAAGDAAMQALAAEDAVGWFRQALELHLAQAGPDEGVRCDLLTKLGAAQRDAGDPTYRDTLFEAAALAEQLDDADRYIDVALAISTAAAFFVLEDPQQLSVITRAVELVEDDDTERRVKLLTAAANMTDLVKVDERREYATQAIELARATGNGRLFLEVLSTTFYADAGPSTHERWLTDSEWAVSRVGLFNDRTLEFTTLMLRANALAAVGRTGDVEAVIEDATRLLGNIGTAPQRLLLQQMNVNMMVNRGDIDGAEQLATDEYAEATSAGVPDALGIYVGRLYVIRLAQGRFDEIVDLFVGATEQSAESITLQAATAYMLCQLGRLDEARRAFPFAREMIETFPDDLTWANCVKCLAYCVAALDEPDLAAVLYDEMLPYQHLFAFSLHTFAGSLQQSLGQVAATMGNLDDAVEHFRAGIRANASARAVYWSAETQLDLADTLELRTTPGDAGERSMLIDAARLTAETFGFAGLERRITTMAPGR